MVHGALHFDSALQRLTGRSRPAGSLSAPFRYLAHRTSQMPPDAIAAHFEAVAGQYRAARDATGLGYFDHRSDFVWERMSERALRAEFDNGAIAAAFRTIELSIDPAIVAGMLRKIRFHPNCQVDRVAVDSVGRPSVALAGEGTLGPYDDVVNALWQERLHIDATAGVLAARPWLHRYKLAVHVSGGAGPALPSTTMPALPVLVSRLQARRMARSAAAGADDRPRDQAANARRDHRGARRNRSGGRRTGPLRGDRRCRRRLHLRLGPDRHRRSTQRAAPPQRHRRP
jgi:hypothetical protein